MESFDKITRPWVIVSCKMSVGLMLVFRMSVGQMALDVNSRRHKKESVRVLFFSLPITNRSPGSKRWRLAGRPPTERWCRLPYRRRRREIRWPGRFGRTATGSSGLATTSGRSERCYLRKPEKITIGVRFNHRHLRKIDWTLAPGNTKGGSITLPLTSCTGPYP